MRRDLREQLGLADEPGCDQRVVRMQRRVLDSVLL
jgi:hypothetical protein